MKQNSEINSKNIIEKTLQHIKHYSQEPRYVIYHTNGMCNFEIFINDIKVTKSFNNESFSTGNEINPYLTGNSNTLKVVLYPREDLGKLDGQTEFDVKVESYENTDKLSAEKQQDNLFVYQAPKDNDKLFKHAGENRFEETKTFKLSNVPYTIDGWKSSQDLRNFDAKILEAKVLEAYKMIQAAFKAKDMDKIAQFSYNKIKDQAVSQYFDKDEVQEGWEELTSIAKAESLEFMPLDHYELVFYGDGRLVGLKSIKKDKGFRGASALLCKFKKEGSWSGAELDYLLHIPKGKTEFEIY
ncbi:hypothetical protein CLU96_3959 [Chryseobacterium sp. 52]|uniref:hypothetical protein n=1 Tax=Chryseobacterium sp. 52 TaxID=2035213 RepID=UPI000C51A9BA|nr:hypothetical protein [Chryseobacterium sp. 52]PIF46913.1 hypothetical protein CLU96_3959 [Chryseobacterium sp. 52]